MSDKPYRPTWVVKLSNNNKRNPKEDTKYVRAATAQEAINTARKVSIVFRGKSYATAHVADPQTDLSASRTSPAASRWFNLLGIGT